MPKGKGTALARLGMMINNREGWYRAILVAAGLKPRDCPICGFTMEYVYNGSVLCCRCFAYPSLTERAKIVLDAARSADTDIRNPINPDDIVVVLDKDGNEVAWYSCGRHHPVWDFSEAYEEIPEDDSSKNALLEGLRVVYQDWWPTAELVEFDEKDAKRVETELVQVGRLMDGLSDSWREDEWIQKASSPAHRLSRMKEDLERFQEEANLKREAEEERMKQQESLDSALRDQGFFHGRTGNAEIPEEALEFRASSEGSRRDPVRTIVSSDLTVEKLEAFVLAVGDGSCVRNVDGEIQIVTGDMGKWIGRGGRVARFLSNAVGSRIEVKEA